MERRVVVASIFAFAVPACSLLTDLDEFAQPTASARVDASASDVAPERAPDAASPAPGAPRVAYHEAVAQDSPVGYWRLGETSGTTMADVVGAHPGTYRGTFALGAAGALEGDSDTATRFSTGQGVVATDFDFAGSVAFSVEAWIKPTVVDDRYRFAIGKRAFGTPARGWTIELYQSEVCGELANTNYNTACGPITAGRFTHVVFTYDGSVCKIYVDGALGGSGNCSTVTLPPTESPLTIGGLAPSDTSFDGTIDEVALYDKVLRAERIAAHHAVATTR